MNPHPLIGILADNGFNNGVNTLGIPCDVAGHGNWNQYEHHDEYVNANQMPERWARDPESQKAYQSGFANGVTDAQNHRQMRPTSPDWHGERLTAYQDGYEHGYRSIRH